MGWQEVCKIPVQIDKIGVNMARMMAKMVFADTG
jgi:hypothetical protein